MVKLSCGGVGNMKRSLSVYRTGSTVTGRSCHARERTAAAPAKLLAAGVTRAADSGLNIRRRWQTARIVRLPPYPMTVGGQ